MTLQLQQELIALMKKGVPPERFPMHPLEENCLRWELGADTHSRLMKFIGKVVSGTPNECSGGLYLNPDDLKAIYAEMNDKSPNEAGKITGEVWVVTRELSALATILMGMYSGDIQWKKPDGMCAPVIENKEELHAFLDGFYSRMY